MYRTAARFVTRCSSDDGKETDMFIGATIKGQDLLKPNRIYEIREGFLGDITLVDIGESLVGSTKAYSWSHDISYLIKCLGRRLLWTKTEALDTNNN